MEKFIPMKEVSSKLLIKPASAVAGILLVALLIFGTAQVTAFFSQPTDREKSFIQYGKYEEIYTTAKDRADELREEKKQAIKEFDEKIKEQGMIYDEASEKYNQLKAELFTQAGAEIMTEPNPAGNQSENGLLLDITQ